jgi:EAL and modified HD-GYP domain-containing signal transduction protein
MTNFINRLFVDRAVNDNEHDFALLNEMSPRAELSERVDTADAHEHKSILCRETIVNRDEKVVGHEFMLKKSITRRVFKGHAMRRLYDQALVSQLVGMPLARLLGPRFALVNFDASHIFDPNLSALPLAQCALILRFGEEDVMPDVCEQVIHLRQQGLRFGLLAHECMNLGMAQLAENMDFAVLDLQEEWVFSADVARWLDERDHLQLLACHIDSSEAFASVWHSSVYGERVAYFQGSFISTRGDWHLPHAQVLRSQVVYLLQCIEREVSTQQLAEALKSDPVIFYKLLRMLNSPAMALDEQISSAEQIIKHLGRDSLYRWLSLLLLSAETQTPDDLQFMDAALLRARLMENLGREQLGAESAAQLFMTGALSLVDALIQQSMSEALQTLALPDGVRQALLARSGPYYPYLQLALAVEQQNQEQVKGLATALGMSEAQVYRCRSEALLWAEQIHQ